MRNNLIRFLIIFLIPGFTFCQQLIKIDDITVNGNKRLTSSDIIRIAQLSRGMEIDLSDIQTAVKNLGKLQRFDDVQIYAETASDNGVILHIEVSELPTLKELSFEGNKKISDSQITELAELNSGTMLSPVKIFNAVQNILAEYREKHFHNVEIDTLIERFEEGEQANLTLFITENKKTKIRELIIDGNEDFSDRRLRWQIKGTKAYKWYLPFRGEYNEDKFAEDKQNLKNYYRKKGYRDFHFISDSVELMPEENGLIVHLNIHEGPQYSYREIGWEGNLIYTEKILNRVVDIKKGDLYNEEKFERAVSEGLYPLYRDDGYFYAQIEPQIIPVGEDSLDISFRIQENQKVNIRKVLITGNDYTQENVIRRYLKIFPGETFSQTKFVNSARDIFILNYFENVVPSYLPYDDDEIDLVYEVIEKRSGVAQLQMGYNAQMGFTGGGSFQFPNFRGTGRTVAVSYQRGVSNTNSGYNQPFLSSYNSSSVSNYQSFSFSFTDPRVLDTPNLLGVSSFYSERGSSVSYLPFDVKQIRGSVRWGREFNWPDRFFSGSWSFSTGNSRYFSSSDDELINYFGNSIESSIETATDGSPYFSTSGISISQTIQRDSRNHPEFPSRGSKFVWISTLSGSLLGGDEDYHKNRFDFNFYTPIVNKLILKSTWVMGAIKPIPVSVGQRSIVPPTARFLMGGSGMPYGEMLRGYTDNTIGPYGTYRPKGGNIIFKYSLELRLLFSENPTVYGLLFAEAGNVWSNFYSVDLYYLKRSFGGGVRTYMPMLGMLGFDVGYGVDDTIYDPDSKPQGWNYHFLFGMPL